MLKLNQKAPEFSLPDEDGNLHTLKEFLGKYLLLYFYPKDDTPGCTTEACNFRDQSREFEKLNTTIIGISADNTKSHKKFKEKHSLPFLLLSDENKSTLKEYGVWQEKKFMGKAYMGISRSSFLIGKNGEILKIYENVNPLRHTNEVIEDIKKLIQNK